MGAGAGAGLGHGLGSLLDQPRQALLNLLTSPWHDQITQQSPPAGGMLPEDNWMAAIPGLLGVGAGAASAMIPGAAPFAGLIGSGVAGMAQEIGSTMAPALAAPSTDDLVRFLGQDPTSGSGQMLSTLAGIGLDPLTYAGGLGGGMGGAAVGGARDALEMKAAQMAAQGEHIAGLEGLAGQASQALEQSQAPKQFAGLMKDVERGPYLNYRSEVQDAMPDLLNSPLGSGKTYKQVDPQLAQTMNAMGLGQPTENGMLMTAGRAPGFAQVRGGWLKPGQGVPQLDLSQGPMAALEDPTYDYQKLLGQTDSLSGPGIAPPGPQPNFAQALGNSGQDLYSNPLAQIDDFPVPGQFATDPTRYRSGNLGDMPVGQANDYLQQKLQAAQAQQQQMAGQPNTPLQQMLVKLGLARNPASM